MDNSRWTSAEKAKYNRYIKKHEKQGYVNILDNQIANDFADYVLYKFGRRPSVMLVRATYQVR